ncbi:MAG: hypothetical protein AAGB25_06280 [Pseudomonadota bacterium]
MLRIFAAAVAALTVAACATSTPYQPALADGAKGYSETQIETDRVMVAFKGNSLTDRETVETYLLFRAAEVTLERGYDYFVITDRETEKETRIRASGGSAFSPYYSRYGFRYSYFHPRFGWYGAYDPFWSDVTYREITRYDASAEIVLRTGEKPGDEVRAFDARDVTKNLASRIQRPEPS